MMKKFLVVSLGLMLMIAVTAAGFDLTIESCLRICFIALAPLFG